MKKKMCNSCSTKKNVVDFGRRAASKDGLSPKCKTCQKVYDKARSKSPERAEARAIYAQSEEGKLAGASAKAAWRKRNPLKAKAMAIVARQIRAGNLVPESCEVCKSEDAINAHHDDYAKPLNVRWLCAAHHSQWHKENGKGKNG